MKHREHMTICDLATRLGVTHSTVSRALSPAPGRARMSRETRERIVRLARELGYRPNAVARNLVSRRTHSIGVIVRHLNDPAASNMVQEIHLNLIRRGYLGMFFSARNPEEFDHALESSLSRRVDGLISVALGAEERAQVARFTAPIVYYGGADRSASSVGYRAVHGAMLAMAHLHDLGHRKIGFIGRTDANNPRYMGFMRFLRLNGLPRDAAWIRSVDVTRLRISVDGVFEEGHRQMCNLMERKDRPTATICHNDVMAIGALRALQAGGWRTPEDMALIGFDNLRAGEYAAVPLTTVDPHLDRIARLLTETLIEQIGHQTSPRPPVHIRIDPTLVIRESTVGVEAGKEPAVHRASHSRTHGHDG